MIHYRVSTQLRLLINQLEEAQLNFSAIIRTVPCDRQLCQGTGLQCVSPECITSVCTQCKPALCSMGLKELLSGCPTATSGSREVDM